MHLDQKVHIKKCTFSNFWPFLHQLWMTISQSFIYVGCNFLCLNHLFCSQFSYGLKFGDGKGLFINDIIIFWRGSRPPLPPYHRWSSFFNNFKYSWIFANTSCLRNTIPIPIRKFWYLGIIPIPIHEDIGSMNLFLFLFAGKKNIRRSLVLLY